MSKRNTESMNVTVSAEILNNPNASIVFSESCGTAKREDTGEEFEISHRLVTGEPVVMLPDGRFVVFPWKSLVSAAYYVGEHFEVCQ